MPEIHATAIVDPSAELGDGVVVGPYSIIERDVCLGERTSVGPHVVIRGGTTIGADNRIFQFSSIGEAPQHQDYRDEPTKLVIGDRNTIREYCTLNRGTADHLGTTRIGNDNFIMAYAHIAHDCVLGNNIIFANGASLAGHVEVGDHVMMGGFSLVHQFCQIGTHCITGIGSVCFQDVPPYIVAAGNSAKPFGINVKGLRRRQYSEQTINLLKNAYKLLYRQGLDLKTAIREIEALDSNHSDITNLGRFLRHSKRGIIR